MSMRAHLLPSGFWADCTHKRCPLPGVPDVTPEVAQQLPLELLEAVAGGPLDRQPGKVTIEGWAHMWFDTAGRKHRAYDLPAVVGLGRFAGYRAWYRHGVLDRMLGRPTVVHEDGLQEWHGGLDRGYMMRSWYFLYPGQGMAPPA